MRNVNTNAVYIVSKEEAHCYYSKDFDIVCERVSPTRRLGRRRNRRHRRRHRRHWHWQVNPFPYSPAHSRTATGISYRFAVLVGTEPIDMVDGVDAWDLKSILDRLVFEYLLEYAA